MKTVSCVVASLVAMTAAGMPFPSSAQSAPEYRVAQTVALGAPDRWDYVVYDPDSGRVFVAHGDELTVVDGESGAIVGRIKGLTGGTHGVALVKDSNRGYTDEGETGKAVSFNLKTLAVEKRLQAAEDADAVAFDPVSHHVFVINGDGGTITVIDPKADTALTTITVGGKLEYAVAGGNGKLFVNGAGKKELVSIDTANNRVVSRWPLPECESPHGLAIDASSHRLFVSCLNQLLTVVDSQSGQIIAKVPIGKGSDAVVFDPKRKLIFSSNGKDGNISVIQEKDAQTYVPLASIKTSISARTLSINPTTGRLYLASADVAPDAVPKNGRMPTIPGSLKLLFIDPVR
jgi:YVTN family beta-propeller protein